MVSDADDAADGIPGLAEMDAVNRILNLTELAKEYLDRLSRLRALPTDSKAQTQAD